MKTKNPICVHIYIGPKASECKRPKRIKKKLERRGGMLRARGYIQDYYKDWPQIADRIAEIWGAR